MPDNVPVCVCVGSTHLRCLRDCRRFKLQYQRPVKQMFVEYLSLEQQMAR